MSGTKSSARSIWQSTGLISPQWKDSIGTVLWSQPAIEVERKDSQLMDLSMIACTLSSTPYEQAEDGSSAYARRTPKR